MKLQIASPAEFPLGLELPWDLPLADWQHPGLVSLARGLCRSVVRFVAYRDAAYALKECQEWRAQREYELLRDLVDLGLPAVEPVCLISGRTGVGVAGRSVLVTRYLDHSLPLRRQVSASATARQASELIDAMVDLLARLHLAGFYWGDCSLSNTLFRLDAGHYAAYLVDAETGERHRRLSDGQREQDVMIATENLAGELMDLEKGSGLPEGVDPIELGASLAPRYRDLWARLHRIEEIPLERRDLVGEKVRELQKLGFEVEELEIETVDGASRLRVCARVAPTAHHRALVRELAGLNVQENQARRLFNDMYAFHAAKVGIEGKDVPVAVLASRWLSEVYHPALAAVPAEQRAKLEDAEIFHQLLEHRWYLSEQQGREVPLAEVVPSYVERILAPMPPPSVESVAAGE